MERGHKEIDVKSNLYAFGVGSSILIHSLYLKKSEYYLNRKG
jgi:hypothetical protein